MDIVERLRFKKELKTPEDVHVLFADAADEIERLRNLYKETCEEKNKEIFEWIEHSKQLVLNSLPWQEENARLRTTFDKIADVFLSKELTDWERLNEIENLTRSVLRENKQ